MSFSTPNIVEFACEILRLPLSVAPAALLRATDALTLVGEHLDIYRQCTGRHDPPKAPVSGVTVGAGARSGKDTRYNVPKGLHEVYFGGHEEHLTRGETAMFPIVCPTKLLTRVTFDYFTGTVLDTPVLRAELVEEPTTERLRFTRRREIVCLPCVAAVARGWSIPVAIENESAFFRFEGNANSDVEVRAALRRGMLSSPNPREFTTSTLYLPSGILHADFRAAWGVDNPDRMFWRASTALMNPSITPERLERERRMDPQRFSREYEAEWMLDVSGFVPPEWIDGAKEAGRRERPPQDGLTYVIAGDTAGGGETEKADWFTCVVVHAEGRGSDARIVQDVMRGRKSANLTATVREYADLARAYRCPEFHGDRYAAGWVRQAFTEAGLRYVDAERTRSEAFLDLEPLLAQGRVVLLDHPELLKELKNLERKAKPGGRVEVTHPPVGRCHDDHANSLALAVGIAMRAVSASQRMQFTNLLTGNQVPGPGAWSGCHGTLT